ncbi:MAG: hypothetical protein HUU15_18015 [Candidatus Brocadiae bacterium]|nr:hypothetical protein [Candidatus Brocadiia bacterium]
MPSPRPLPPPAPLTRLTLSSDPGRDAALLAAAVRGALREKGIAVTVPEPGEEADLHLLHLVAGSPAPGAFFQPLRAASELVEPIAPILRSLEDAQSPEERAAWYAAWEAALLERSLVLPLARGVCHSLERADSPVTIDPFGRYLPKTPAPATAR